MVTVVYSMSDNATVLFPHISTANQRPVFGSREQCTANQRPVFRLHVDCSIVGIFLQPIRDQYLGHVNNIQPIRDRYLGYMMIT